MERRKGEKRGSEGSGWGEEGRGGDRKYPHGRRSPGRTCPPL